MKIPAAFVKKGDVEYPGGSFEANFATHNFANVDFKRTSRDASDDVSFFGSGRQKSYARANVAIYWGNTPTPAELATLNRCLS